MKSHLKKILFRSVSVSLACLTLAMSGCSAKTADSGAASASDNGGNSKAASGGKATITYACWQSQELAGMKAIADKFMEENPDITVNVELTPWDQYWTKLQAAASGGSLPDVFWMHANNFYQYAKNGKLLDITDKFEQSDLDWSNYPADLVDFYKYDGKNYAIPKDYDTIGLWYNKTLFDEKGIAYPDDTWTWDTLKENAKLLTDTAKGIYGFMAPVSMQEYGYNFIYQNEGNVISDDKKKSGYDSQETQDAIQYLVDFATVDKSSPTVDQFSNTTYLQYFLSGNAAMGFFGSWNVADFLASDYVKNNCDVAVLPQGKTRASIYNGLGNSIAYNTKYPEQSWKFVEYLGGKEANELQSQYGAAIPAYKGLEQGWLDHFNMFDCKIYSDQLEYGVMYPNSPSQATWGQYESDILPKVFKGDVSVKDGCDELASKMNEAIAAE